MKNPNLQDLDGFEWDEANQDKIKKRISLKLVEAAFLGEPLIMYDAQHSHIEPRWFLINRVGDRYVVVIFTVRKNKVRVISARHMHKREIKKYAKKIF